MMKLQGFKPWDTWVPMPFPNKELGYARLLYSKGMQLMIHTPDFVDFANEIANITSRNLMIMKGKLSLCMIIFS